MGCSSPRIEEGSTDHRERAATARSSKPVPCPSLGGARPMPLGEAIHRAPSLHRGCAPASARSSPRKRRRPRKGYAERVVRKHGSLASSHDRIRMPVVPVRGRWLATAPRRADLAPGGNTRTGERGGGSLSRGIGFGASRPRTRTEAGASRGGGFTARGRARASKCVAEIGRQPQAHRSPLETPMLLIHVRCVGALQTPVRRRCAARGSAGAQVEGEHPGQRRKAPRPGALDDKAIAGRTAPWTFTGSHSRRKARVGIDQALGSPSVLPKEGTPDRPLARILHGIQVTAVLARTNGFKVVCEDGVLPRSGDRSVRSSIVRSYPGQHPGPVRAVRRKRATTS